MDFAEGVCARAGSPGLLQPYPWSRRQESNLYLPLRRRPFYPLNYGERGAESMASIPKVGTKRRALVRRVGPKPICKTHSTKAAAEAWARRVEAQIDFQSTETGT